MYYFSNKKLAKFARKRTEYKIFMINKVLNNIVKKAVKKRNLHYDLSINKEYMVEFFSYSTMT